MENGGRRSAAARDGRALKYSTHSCLNPWGRRRGRIEPDAYIFPSLSQAFPETVKSRHKRIALILAALAALACAVALVMNAFQSNLVFFLSPSDVLAGKAPAGRAFRVGGM